MPPNATRQRRSPAAPGPSYAGRSASVTEATSASPFDSPTDACDRNTERSRSGRSSSSAVGPENRIRPRSMKYARSATVSATLTLCSTRITATPASASRRTIGSSWRRSRRQAERELVDQEHLRSGDERHRRARASAAGRRTGRRPATLARSRSTGNISSTSAIAAATSSGSRRRRPAGELQVLLHGQARRRRPGRRASG